MLGVISGPYAECSKILIFFKKLHGRSSASVTPTSLSHILMKKKVQLFFQNNGFLT